MPDVGLGDQADHRGPGVEQRLHLGVVLDPDTGLPRGAEGDQLRVREVQLGARPGEELGVLGQGPGPAALDVADADLVEQPGDGQLVGDGVAHALSLGAVPQGRVEDVEVQIGGGVLGHGVSRGARCWAQTRKNLPGYGRLRAVGEVTAR